MPELSVKSPFNLYHATKFVHSVEMLHAAAEVAPAAEVVPAGQDVQAGSYPYNSHSAICIKPDTKFTTTIL